MTLKELVDFFCPSELSQKIHGCRAFLDSDRKHMITVVDACDRLETHVPKEYHDWAAREIVKHVHFMVTYGESSEPTGCEWFHRALEDAKVEYRCSEVDEG